ncbi:FecR family protein, partial [Nostoc sp. T09]|uniref:FecR family protein n=1 Tax=Nostoc sp. T09 TaxID=1932621 RepID=UPI001180F656
MLQKFLPLLVIGVWGAIVLPFSERTSATTPLTRAEIQELRNLVQLIPKNSPKKRPARKSDALIPGDGLSTGRASLADLRFNDGSLARVGEQAVFQFLPKTRNFRLKNGTVLLLIPPGRGQTRIQTPNAAAAIRGSALFVRYDEKTDTTIVGALTNSGIEVSNKQASQSQVLEAGQLMVIVKGKFQGLYDFDLRNFYDTSDLVRGLDLTRQNLTPTPDPAIASVQAETATAVAAQTPIKGEGVVENPSFLELTASSSNSTNNENNNDSNNNNSSVDTKDTTVKDTLSVDTFVDTGQAQFNEQSVNNTNNVGVDTTQTSPKPQIPSSVDQPNNPNPNPGPKPDGGAGNPNPGPK